MNTIQFLEEMASNVHHNPIVNKLANEQPDEIRSAFLAKDSDTLKNQISSNCNADNVACVAHTK